MSWLYSKRKADDAPTGPSKKRIRLLSAEVSQLLYSHQIKSGTAYHIFDGPFGACEPLALAQASTKARDEVLPMFYCDNDFVVYVKQYNIRGVMDWLAQANQYREAEGGRACLGSVELVMPECVPHWENLVDWLQEMHDGKVVGLAGVECDEEDRQVRAVKGAFTQVALLREFEWEVVELMLPGVREVLGAMHEGWLADPEASKEGEVLTDEPDKIVRRLRKLSAPKESLADDFMTDGEVLNTERTYRTALENPAGDEQADMEDVNGEMSASMTMRDDDDGLRFQRATESHRFNAALAAPEAEESQDDYGVVDHAFCRW
ncbi:hypothetical protein B0A55_00841 [Friedmanniomyces simplex]|uniref:Uncharacterized protein n=1 Tax=Friedmanniomyces simplex TaxID=329884 RepID=A0A4U0XYF5_9PEZI|nr:hypothetical protein B0A55_00841 [Friedmanniomyces simplex]